METPALTCLPKKKTQRSDSDQGNLEPQVLRAHSHVAWLSALSWELPLWHLCNTPKLKLGGNHHSPSQKCAVTTKHNMKDSGKYFRLLYFYRHTRQDMFLLKIKVVLIYMVCMGEVFFCFLSLTSRLNLPRPPIIFPVFASPFSDSEKRVCILTCTSLLFVILCKEFWDCLTEQAFNCESFATHLSSITFIFKMT